MSWSVQVGGRRIFLALATTTVTVVPLFDQGGGNSHLALRAMFIKVIKSTNTVKWLMSVSGEGRTRGC